MITGERIKQLREERGMSQDDLAKALGLKSRSSIARLEKAEDITLKDIKRISKVLGCDPHYLMGWSDNPNKESNDVQEEVATPKKIVTVTKTNGETETFNIDAVIRAVTKTLNVMYPGDQADVAEAIEVAAAYMRAQAKEKKAVNTILEIPEEED